MDISVRERLAFSQGILKKLFNLISMGKNHFGISTLEQFARLPIAEYARELDEYINAGKVFMFRTGIPKESDLYLNALYEHNLWNTFSICRYNYSHDSIECFYLCSTRDNMQLIEACTNNLSFIHYWINLIAKRLKKLLLLLSLKHTRKIMFDEFRLN